MILKIDKNYFKSLVNGEHKLKVRFKDGHAEGVFEVKDKISFSILGTTFTATKGMTWGDWIKSFNVGASGNDIVWVSTTEQLYIDTRYKPNWDQGFPIGSEEEALYDSDDVRQTLHTPIVDGASYGRSSNAPN